MLNTLKWLWKEHTSEEGYILGGATQESCLKLLFQSDFLSAAVFNGCQISQCCDHSAVIACEHICNEIDHEHYFCTV